MEETIAKLVASYTPDEHAHEVLAATPTILIVGISGAGKGTIRDALLKTGQYYNIATHVTRPPRFNNGILETEGVEHHFVSTNDAIGMLKNHVFIEANIYVGNMYATSVVEFERAQAEGKTAIADIDINGVESFRKISSKVMPIFIVPPSYEIWMERLKGRFSDGWYKHASDISSRAKTASDELGYVLARNDYTLVINDSLSDAVTHIEKIVAGQLPDDQATSAARHVMNDIKHKIDAGTLDD